MTPWPYRVGQSYNRRKDIHDLYGGQQQQGIVTPARYPLIICITGSDGRTSGYEDEWLMDGSIDYYGEGAAGDMAFTHGNQAIAEHVRAGEDILVFSKVQRDGTLRFEGQFVFTGHRIVDAPDIHGQLRKAIVFRLAPIDTGVRHDEPEADEISTEEISLSELRERAIAAGADRGIPPVKAAQTVHRRSSIVRRYVLRRAAGQCELCREAAPFRDHNGAPYLEPHHIRRLSDGGPDDPRFMGALCPNCHRRIHHGQDGSKLNSTLQDYITRIEGN